MAGGVVSFFIDVFSHGGNRAFGGTFFILGLAIFLTIRVWKNIFQKGSE
jgi:hypothetical protein